MYQLGREGMSLLDAWWSEEAILLLGRMHQLGQEGEESVGRMVQRRRSVALREDVPILP